MNVVILNIIIMNVVMLNVIMLNVIMINVIMINVIMINVIMLNVIRLNVIMLNVVAPWGDLDYKKLIILLLIDLESIFLNWFSSSITVTQNKLGCLPLESFLGLALYLLLRPTLYP